MTSYLSSISSSNRKKTPDQLVGLTKQCLQSLIAAVTVRKSSRSVSPSPTTFLSSSSTSHPVDGGSDKDRVKVCIATDCADKVCAEDALSAEPSPVPQQSPSLPPIPVSIPPQLSAQSISPQTQESTSEVALLLHPIPIIAATAAAGSSSSSSSSSSLSRAKVTNSAVINGPTTVEELSAALGKLLTDMKVVLCGDLEHPVIDESKALELSAAVQAADLFPQLISYLAIISFESRKDVGIIFHQLLKKDIGGFVSYLCSAHLDTVRCLVLGYSQTEIALNCGLMLRDCIKHDAIVKYLFDSLDLLWLFFESFVHLPNFDVASDAFNTLKELLTMPQHQQIATDFLESHVDIFLEKYEVCSPRCFPSCAGSLMMTCC
jgi:hypothetical protein